MKIGIVLFCAIVNEYVINILKDALPILERGTFAKITAIVLGIGEALVFGADIGSVFGYEAVVPYFGNVLTGVLIAGGSAVVFDLWKKFIKARAEVQQVTPEDYTDQNDEGIM